VRVLKRGSFKPQSLHSNKKELPVYKAKKFEKENVFKSGILSNMTKYLRFLALSGCGDLVS